ncbi:MAG: DUF6701 domain-containing protein [Betaproteobacteria bacterium]
MRPFLLVLLMALAGAAHGAPVFQAAGVAVSGTGAVVPPWPAHVAGDVALLVIESRGNQAANLSNAQGFAAVANSPQNVNAPVSGTRLTVYWRRATSAAMAAPTVGDPGNHVRAQIFTYRGVVSTGDPWNVTGGGTQGAPASTSVTVTGIATTVPDTLVVQAVTRHNDSAAASFSNQVNANLLNLAERDDGGTTSGDGGGFAVWDGVKTDAGATGNTTATVASSVKAFLSIALLPEPVTCVAGLAGGINGEYFSNMTLAGSATGTRVDGPVDFNWAGGAPGVTGIGADNFSVRWDGVLRAGVSGNFQFQTVADDGVRLWVNGQLMIDNWVDQAAHTETSGNIALAAGQAYAIRLEYYENGGQSEIRLRWRPPGDPGFSAIPAGPTPGLGAGLYRCLPPYTHYSVSYPNGTSFATCEPALVRITAHDDTHAAAAPAAGTVLTINTTTANGVWQSPIVSGTNASWAPSGADNGQATYTWDGVESFIEMRLRRNSAGALGLNLSDSNGRGEDGGEDPSVSFADSVLRVTADGSASASINTQIAGKLNTEGAGVQALFVQAVATAPATGACTTLFQGQNQSVEFAAVCNNPTACSVAAGTEFQLIDRFGTAQNVVKHDDTPTPGSYTPVSLAFSNDANAMAPLAFRYGDAGQVTLHLRYTLPAPPATTISGTSNAFVVRPFGIAVRGANAGTAIAHSSTDAGTLLAAAGDPFTMTLAAYKWQSAAEDLNNNGVPDFAAPDVVDLTDNGLTPNFAANVSLSALTNLPGVALGEIRRGGGCPGGSGTVSAGSWSGGAATLADTCYTEAGNVKIAVFATDYIEPGVSVFGLSSFDGTGFTGGHVGRFRPKHFALSGATLTTRHGAACTPASSFTYLDEPLRLAFTLTAQSAQDATTQNYTGSYAKLGLNTFGNWVLGARDGTTDLSGRLDTGVAPAGSWANGVASGIELTTAVLRATPDAPDGPFAATAFGIAPADSDGVAMNTLDLDADNNTIMDRKNLGVSAELRYGRLRVNNALGSARLVLPVPLRLEYWNGTAFALNTADSCTTLARNTLALGSYIGALAPGGGNCKTFVQQDPVVFASGAGTLRLAAPTGGATGSVLVTPQLRGTAAGFSCDNASSGEDAIVSAARPYLVGRWNDALDPDAIGATAYDDNPSGRASFGLFGGQPNNYIYFRENY